MSVTLDIKLKKTNKIYHEGEVVSGLVVVSSPSDVRHDGISLLMEGVVSLQLSNKNIGMFEAFRNSVKPITLINCTLDLQAGGKLPLGITEIPFELPLATQRQRQPSVGVTSGLTQSCLLETYHGVFVSITYVLRCTMKRSFLNKDLSASCEFMVQYRKAKDKVESKPIRCVISPQTIQNARSLLGREGDGGRIHHAIPKFNILAELDATVCPLDKPFTGQITVKECSVPIKSIELQLVRVETCGCAEGYARDATEIQNIQIGEEDVCRHLPIPIYMLLPRLFTCPTTLTTNFKIEFEVNVAIIFQDDHLVTENFPITLTRS